MWEFAHCDVQHTKGEHSGVSRLGQMPTLAKSAYYAFDSVVAVAAGARKLYLCGRVKSRDASSQCSKDMSTFNSYARQSQLAQLGKNMSYFYGSTDLYDSIRDQTIAEDAEMTATGALAFSVENTKFFAGDRKHIEFDIVNYVTGVKADTGVFKSVGSWEQMSDQGECELAKCKEEGGKDCLQSKQKMHGYCGELKIIKGIQWMGGDTATPADRAGGHDMTAPQYMTLALVFLCFSIVGGNALELCHFHYIPEAGFTILVGIFVGFLIKFYTYVTKSYKMEEMATFDEHTFSLVLLPIIIFDAGFGAKKFRFFGNIGPIMLFALFGTTISTFLIGGLIFQLGESGISDVRMGLAESLTYGAVISAVDPVATLAVFGVLKVEPNLNYRVFGESIINDAVSIVLFRVCGKFMTKTFDTMGLLGALGSFLSISFGSVFLGVAVAFVASWVLKLAHIHDPLLASGAFIICSYISYEITESMHFSGIIASLFCGFMMKHYALANISPQYQSMVKDMVHMLASLSDLVIFFMVGENVVLFAPYDKKIFMGISLGLCLLGRMCNIFPLAAIYNIFQGMDKRDLTVRAEDTAGKKYCRVEVDDSNTISYDMVDEGRGLPVGIALNNDFCIYRLDGHPAEGDLVSKTIGFSVVAIGGKEVAKGSDVMELLAAEPNQDEIEVTIGQSNAIGFKDQLVMFHAGLRGAIAFALALQFPSQNKKHVIDAVTLVILFTVFVLGGTTVTVLTSLGIKLHCKDDPENLKLVDAKLHNNKAKEEGGKKDMMFWFYSFEFWLKHLITRSPEEDIGVFAQPWEDLTEDEVAAATLLGYHGPDSENNKVWPEIQAHWGIWDTLSEEQKEAAKVLGLDDHRWPPPDFSHIADADDFVKQHKSGHDAGFVEAEVKTVRADTTENPIFADDDDGDGGDGGEDEADAEPQEETEADDAAEPDL